MSSGLNSANYVTIYIMYITTIRFHVHPLVLLDEEVRLENLHRGTTKTTSNCGGRKIFGLSSRVGNASPIIDLVRCNNRIVVPAPSVSEEAVIPKVNLNAEVLQLEIKALVPNKPDVTTEQKALEPVIDVKTEASKCEQKMLAQPLKSNNKFGTTMEPNLLEPALDIKQDANPL